MWVLIQHAAVLVKKRHLGTDRHTGRGRGTSEAGRVEGSPSQGCTGVSTPGTGEAWGRFSFQPQKEPVLLAPPHKLDLQPPEQRDAQLLLLEPQAWAALLRQS